jgi:hypothetical protein
MGLAKHGVANVGSRERFRKKWSGFAGEILGRASIDESAGLEQEHLEASCEGVLKCGPQALSSAGTAGRST